jgi:hypothetical protein
MGRKSIFCYYLTKKIRNIKFKIQKIEIPLLSFQFKSPLHYTLIRYSRSKKVPNVTRSSFTLIYKGNMWTVWFGQKKLVLIKKIFRIKLFLAILIFINLELHEINYQGLILNQISSMRFLQNADLLLCFHKLDMVSKDFLPQSSWISVFLQSIEKAYYSCRT